jgi:tetratricopeptide (TPR) repeat protein
MLIMKNKIAFYSITLCMLIPLLACASRKNTHVDPTQQVKSETVTTPNESTVNHNVTSSSSHNGQSPNSVLQEEKRPEECLHPWGENPEDSLEMRRTVFLYEQAIDAKDYVLAYPMWQKIMEKAPCARIGPYADVEVMFPQLFTHADFKNRYPVLLDSFLWSFERRAYIHGDEGQVLGRLAYYLNTYKPKEVERVISLCEQVIRIAGNDIEYIVASTYMNAIFVSLKNNKISKEAVFGAYDKIADIMEHNITHDQTYSEIWKNIRDNSEESMKKFLSCSDIDDIFIPRFTENPTDVILMERILKFYRTSRCLDNANYIKVSKKLFEINPGASSAEELAKYYENNNDFNTAVEYYLKAAELTEDNARKENIYLKLAYQYFNKKNYSQASQYANRVLSINASNGRALIVIGEVKYYTAQNTPDCDAFWKRASAWVAMDYFQKAISVDPSVREDAQAKINSYKSRCPLKEDGFFRSIMENATVNVGCISSTTTARYFD